jgi:serine/threonine-protein kinase
MNEAVGQVVGSVTLRQKIADGGMGTVWLAEHRALRREVAVKFLAAPPGPDDDGGRRFAMEGRTLARIQSRFVPQVFDQGETDDGTPYIVMELLDGVDLRAWVGRYGLLDASEVARLLDQVGQALSAAHDLGIVHRDVKPENIIITGGREDFVAKLIDFGIAKSLALPMSAPSLTVSGTTIGSAGHMSPEQLLGAPDVDERSDVWSLAVVAYWCLTGKSPFAGETYGGVCFAIERGDFPPVSGARGELPVALDAWFTTALAREPDARFATARLMCAEFRGALATDPSLVGTPMRLSANAPPPRTVVTGQLATPGRSARPHAPDGVGDRAGTGRPAPPAPVGLGDLLEERGLLDLDAVVQVLDAVGLAMIAEHGPGEVSMLPERPRGRIDETTLAFHAHLTDLGLALSAALSIEARSPSARGTVVGRPGFLGADEALSQDALDARSEVWALGVIAYWCLTGLAPFDREVVRGVRVAVAEGRFTPLSVLRPGLHPAIDGWFERIFAPDVAQRFASPVEAILAFRAAAEHHPTWPVMAGAAVVAARVEPGDAALLGVAHTARAPRIGRGKARSSWRGVAYLAGAVALGLVASVLTLDARSPWARAPRSGSPAGGSAVAVTIVDGGAHTQAVGPRTSPRDVAAPAPANATAQPDVPWQTVTLVPVVTAGRQAARRPAPAIRGPEQGALPATETPPSPSAPWTPRDEVGEP